MSTPRFGTVVTAMVTPMRADGAIDIDEAKRLASWLVDHGSGGIVVCGTTGEGPTLTDAEKISLFAAVASAVRGGAKVIANAGGNDTRRSVEFSKQAAECGIDGILVVGPYYNKPPQAGLIDHFTAIADAVPLPMMIYNIPGRTAVNILPDTILALSGHPNIVAVKESSGDLMQIAEICALAPHGFEVYSGDDHLALPVASIGGVGVVSVASHLAGDDIKSMLELHSAGDVEAAASIHQRLLPLIRAIFATTSPIPVKAAVARFGFSVGRCRLPLCTLTSEQQRALDAAIAPWVVPADERSLTRA